MNRGNENHMLTSIAGGQAATPWLAKEEQQDSTQGKTRVPDDGQSCFSFGPKASAGSHMHSREEGWPPDRMSSFCPSAPLSEHKTPIRAPHVDRRQRRRAAWQEPRHKRPQVILALPAQLERCDTPWCERKRE